MISRLLYELKPHACLLSGCLLLSTTANPFFLSAGLLLLVLVPFCGFSDLNIAELTIPISSQLMNYLFIRRGCMNFYRLSTS